MLIDSNSTPAQVDGVKNSNSWHYIQLAVKGLMDDFRLYDPSLDLSEVVALIIVMTLQIVMPIIY